MKKPTVYIITVSDLWGREIKLSDTTWRGHIIADHPEVRGQLRKVETTIKRPEHVIRVAERNTVIYDSSTTTGLFFNVVVNDKTWLVRTVYMTFYMLLGDIIYTVKKK